MRYEIEQAGLGREHGPDVGTHAQPTRWYVVNVLNACTPPASVTWDAYDNNRQFLAGTVVMTPNDSEVARPDGSRAARGRRARAPRRRVQVLGGVPPTSPTVSGCLP